jgi:hypothetical protein
MITTVFDAITDAELTPPVDTFKGMVNLLPTVTMASLGAVINGGMNFKLLRRQTIPYQLRRNHFMRHGNQICARI